METGRSYNLSSDEEKINISIVPHRFAINPGRDTIRKVLRRDRYYIHVYQTRVDAERRTLRSKSIARELKKRFEGMYWPRDIDNQTQKRETHDNRIRTNMRGTPKMGNMQRTKWSAGVGRCQRVLVTKNNTWGSREVGIKNIKPRWNKQNTQRNNRRETDYSRSIRRNRDATRNEKSDAKLDKISNQLQKVTQLLERMVQRRNTL